jgi:alpha-galactosidase/6-phospho-beta-glucosidase family protein
MPKITFVGAGSAVFTYEIITDILSTPALDTGTFALVDIDAERLELVQQVAKLAVAKSGKVGASKRPRNAVRCWPAPIISSYHRSGRITKCSP